MDSRKFQRDPEGFSAILEWFRGIFEDPQTLWNLPQEFQKIQSTPKSHLTFWILQDSFGIAHDPYEQPTLIHMN